MVIHEDKITNTIFKVSFLFLALSCFSAFTLTLPSALADDSIVDEIQITIPVSCSMSSTVSSEHASEVNNGQTVSDIGTTNLKVICNDNSGYAIYAIGYTDDTYGKTVLTNPAISSTNDIITSTTVTTGTSSWAMKLTAVSGTYTPIIAGSTGDNLKATGDPDFSNYTAIPEEYTKVAYHTSSTDTGTNATGSNLTTTYRAYISPSQPAGTYVGQVKYTLVHPNMTDDSNKPVTPLTSTDCPAGYICYAPNASDIEGSMASLGAIASSEKAGKRSSGTSAITANLIAPNYKRSGYGFAGWSTEYNYISASTSPIYGPNENIAVDLSSSGLILYPVWVESTGSLQGWTGCSSLTQATYNSSTHTMTADLSSVTALTDARDGNVYAVARLADGRCWMIENLRLDDSATITIANTNNPLKDTNNAVALNANGITTNHLAATSNSWCTNNSEICDNQTMLNTNNINRSSNPSHSSNSNNSFYQWYSYGNYYNWYSATAGNGTYGTNSGNVAGDLCPAGWHLPYGGSGSGTGGGNTAGGFYYLNTQMSNNTYGQGSKDWRMFPNNFIKSGFWEGSYTYNRGGRGTYWSSSANGSDGDLNIYFLYLYSDSRVYPGDDISNKYGGKSVRCVADS